VKPRWIYLCSCYRFIDGTWVRSFVAGLASQLLSLRASALDSFVVFPGMITEQFAGFIRDKRLPKTPFTFKHRGFFVKKIARVWGLVI